MISSIFFSLSFRFLAAAAVTCKRRQALRCTYAVDKSTTNQDVLRYKKVETMPLPRLPPFRPDPTQSNRKTKNETRVDHFASTRHDTNTIHSAHGLHWANNDVLAIIGCPAGVKILTAPAWLQLNGYVIIIKLFMCTTSTRIDLRSPACTRQHLIIILRV